MIEQLQKNLDGYRILLEIEVGLREYIISEFNEAFPSINWFYSENIISAKKINESEERRKYNIEKGWDAKNAASTHGLYFLYLTDLKDIVNKKYKDADGIVEVFNLNRNQIESICSGLQSIFPIRNKIAHSVYISQTELDALKSVVTTLNNLIPDFELLAKQPEIRLNDEIKAKIALKSACCAMIELEIVNEEELNLHSNNWKYLQTERGQRIFKLIHQYVMLSKSTGTFVQQKNLVEDNIEELKEICKDEKFISR